jgi:hypothetical protein
MRLLNFLGCFKPKAQRAQTTPPRDAGAPSEFDKALVELKVNGAVALFIVLAEDGSVNRLGDGSVSNTDHQLSIGLSHEPLFAQFMTRITPEILECQGEYKHRKRKGANCELTLLLSYRGSDRVAGFRFIYGSESQGPPREIAELVRYADELTRPWHEELKRSATTKK